MQGRLSKGIRQAGRAGGGRRTQVCWETSQAYITHDTCLCLHTWAHPVPVTPSPIKGTCPSLLSTSPSDPKPSGRRLALQLGTLLACHGTHTHAFTCHPPPSTYLLTPTHLQGVEEEWEELTSTAHHILRILCIRLGGLLFAFLCTDMLGRSGGGGAGWDAP